MQPAARTPRDRGRPRHRFVTTMQRGRARRSRWNHNGCVHGSRGRVAVGRQTGSACFWQGSTGTSAAGLRQPQGVTPGQDAGGTALRDAIRTMATSGVMARAGLWSALAFVLNLAWEIAQVRMYTIWAEADSVSVAWALFHCSLGDVVIALAMFALAGMMLRRADWPAPRPWAGGAGQS